MKIPETGLSEGELFETLERYRQADNDWRAGRTFGYVFDAGREIERVAKRAYTAFLSENALDPTIFPSLLRLENEVVGMALEHLSAPPGAAGNFTSGGTESIILAVKAARDAFRDERPDVALPEMLLPVTAHAAFHKAAHYLGVRAVPVAVDRSTLRADVDAMRRAIGPNTMLLVASAPSYAHGVVDPIRELGKVAHERGLLFHVDACIGGFLLPYFARLGEPVPDFDFRVPGVTSVSMDLHKYAYCAKGASTVLFREKSLRRRMIYACARWSGYAMVNTTVQSTKSGGPLAAAWAVLGFVGESGYLDIARRLRDAMREIVAGIRATPGLRVLGNPDMTLVAVACDTASVFALADEMKACGWYIQPQLGLDGNEPSFHLSLYPSNVPEVADFLRDLRTCLARAEKLPKAGTDDLRSILGHLDENSLSPQMFSEILAMAGVRDGALPDRTADINAMLAALPPALVERLLTEFVNELFSAEFRGTT